MFSELVIVHYFLEGAVLKSNTKRCLRTKYLWFRVYSHYLGLMLFRLLFPKAKSNQIAFNFSASIKFSGL